uniref:Putative rhip mic-2099 secreted protein n=1 Tax=Rhipicephalus pulchellus TaxID=72859 RepID=L7LYM6_RHIPC
MHGLARVTAFLVASVSGSLLAVIVLQYRAILDSSGPTPPIVLPRSPSYRKWLSDQGLVRAASGAVNEARLLYERVPVLCLVRATSAQQARSVLNTWSRRCNRAVFFGSLSDPYVPVVRVPSGDTCGLFAHVLAQHGGSFRWLLLVDDETFAVVENLRLYVAPLNASEVHYLGHPVRWGAGFYNALAAGIALSEGAVRALRNRCRPAELERMVAASLPRAPPVDTRDTLLRGRFNLFSVEQMLMPGSVAYGHRRSSIFRSPEGGHCCSQHAITFHGVNPVDMFLLEYLVYGLHVGPGGGPSPTSSPPANVPMELTSLLKGKAFVKPYGITAF